MAVEQRQWLRNAPAIVPPVTLLEADRQHALRQMAVSRETEARLSIYVDRLLAWQRIKNLVAASTLDRIWTRHIADSAQLVALAPDAARWVDLGSGAGFPGLVIAIMLAHRPGIRVDLVESNGRKCAFLRDVVRETGAPARVHTGRIEAVLPALLSNIEVVTSRALAPLPVLIDLSRNLLDRGAVGLFLTGEAGGDSPDGMTDRRLTIESVASRTQPGARIMRVRVRRSSADAEERGPS